MASCSIVSATFFTYFYSMADPGILISDVELVKKENNLTFELELKEEKDEKGGKVISWHELVQVLESQKRRLMRIYDVQDRKHAKLIGEHDLNELGSSVGQLLLQRHSDKEASPEEILLPQSVVECDWTQFSLIKNLMN